MILGNINAIAKKAGNTGISFVLPHSYTPGDFKATQSLVFERDGYST